MLKIKDNVDLRELEKFGFTITENNWEKRGEDCFEAVKKIYNDTEIKILVLVSWRVITLRIEINCYDETGYSDYEDIYATTLYDLIQAGLVEKVEDK